MLARNFFRPLAMWLVVLLSSLVLSTAVYADTSMDDMFIAIRNGDAEMVTELLQQGVDANLQDGQGYTALMMAAREGSPDVVGQLLAHGAKVYLRNLYGETAVMLAAYNGHNSVIEQLVVRGAALGANGRGWNPLMYAVYAGHAGTARLLLSYGVPVDEQTDAGLSALMLAAKNGCIDCVTLLLRLGANPGLRSRQGESALEMALSVGNTDIGELLEQAARIRGSKSLK